MRSFHSAAVQPPADQTKIKKMMKKTVPDTGSGPSCVP